MRRGVRRRMARFRFQRTRKARSPRARRRDDAAFQSRRASRRARIAKAVAACAVLVVLGVLPLFVNDPIGYVPVLAYVALVALSGAYVLVAAKRLKVTEMASSGTCVRGTTMQVGITLANKSPLVLLRIEPRVFVSDVFGNVDKTQALSLSLGPFETYEFGFDVKMEHLGFYQAGVQDVVVHDLFGLFSRRIAGSRQCRIEVLPRVIDVSGLRFKHDLMKEQPRARTPIAQDGSDYVGSREYRMGDPMKAIHWKLSARGDVYYTKLFKTLGAPGIEAVLDFESPAYDSEDLMCVYDVVVESGLSIGAYARKNGMDFTLVYRDRQGSDARVGLGSTAASRASLIMSLPRVTAEARTGAAVDLLRREIGSRTSQPNIAFVTASVDDAVINALLVAKRRGGNPSLVAVVPPSMEGRQRDQMKLKLRRLDVAKVSYLMVSSADQMGVDAA